MPKPISANANAAPAFDGNLSAPLTSPDANSLISVSVPTSSEEDWTHEEESFVGHCLVDAFHKSYGSSFPLDLSGVEFKSMTHKEHQPHNEDGEGPTDINFAWWYFDDSCYHTYTWNVSQNHISLCLIPNATLTIFAFLSAFSAMDLSGIMLSTSAAGDARDALLLS